MKKKENSITNKASETLNRFKESIIIRHGRTSKKTKIITGFSALVLGIAVIAFSISISLTVYSLSANGYQVGYIDKPSEINKTTQTITADFQTKIGIEAVAFDGSKVVVTKAGFHKNDVELLSSANLKKILSDPSLYTANTWVIKIDGKSMMSATSEAAANGILDAVKKSYKADNTELISASFKQNVTVSNEVAPLDLIMDPKEAVQLILNGTVSPKTYAVKAGDTMWGIASKTGMKQAELALANPGLKMDKLKIGQTLNLFEKKSYVTVVTTEKVAENKPIKFKTVYENSGALYKGETKLKSAGVLGSESTEMEIVKENGVWKSTKVLGTKVISEPVTQVALKGTKSLSTYAGSGNLNWPVAGSISSGYGSRGGGRHSGLDIRMPNGSPIHAADDGVVLSARYDGAYGNLIKLNHGNGVQTWYAHCKSFSASVGDIVKKGDTIAYVGITGRSTGYHLHFEVRIDGVSVNPLNHL